MKYSVDLFEMIDPYVLIGNATHGGTVSGATLVKAPVEIVYNGFESGSAPWIFWEDNEEESSPSNAIEMTYDEAYEGNACGKLMFNQASEAIVMDIFSMTDSADKIRSRPLTFRFYAKNATASDISFFVDVDNGDSTSYSTGDTLPTIATGSNWTKYEFTRTYFIDPEAEYFAIGFKKATGTGSVLIDNLTITIANDHNWAINGGFETDLSGWSFINNNYNNDSNLDNTATRINSDGGAIGTWCADLSFGNSGGYGYVYDAYTVTDNLFQINRVNFTVVIRAKTTMPNAFATVRLDGAYTYEGDTLGIGLVNDGAWHEYTMSGKYVITSGSKFQIGVKTTAGTPVGTIRIDGVRLYAKPELSETPSSTVLPFSSNMTYADWAGLVGSRLVFDTGKNINYGSVISSIVNSGSTISQITLAEAMPSVPEDGVRFSILVNNFYRTSGTGTKNMVSVSDYVDETLSISSSAEDGYTKAEIVLGSAVLGTALGTPNVLGWRVVVGSNFGQLWEGYVDYYSLADDKLTLNALGYKTLLGKARYAGFFTSDNENTVPVIARNILSSCPELFHTAASIDRGNTIHNLQKANGGVGPMDFSSRPIMASEAMEQLLRIGYFGDDSFDETTIQVWGNATAYLKRLKRQTEFADADWFVDGSSVSGNRDISISATRSGYGNVYYGVYRGENGEQLETAGVYDVKDARKYGLSEKQISTGGLQEGEIYLALEVQSQTKQPIASVGDLSLTGNVGRSSGSYNVPCVLIKGGDVMYIADVLRSAYISYLGDTFTQSFIVGEITANLIDDTVRITPRRSADKVETLVTQLEINTGYDD